MAIAVAGFLTRARLWRQGQPVYPTRSNQPRERLLGVLRQLFIQTRLQRDPARGPGHWVVSLGTLFMLLAMAIIWFQNFGWLLGAFNRYFRVVLEYVALVALIGLVALFIRRWVRRPVYAPRTLDDFVIPVFLAAIIKAALLSEAAKVAITLSVIGPGAVFAGVAADRPVAALIAPLFVGLGLRGPEALGSTAQGLSWLHSILAWGFVGYMGWTKMRHPVLAVMNIYRRRTTPPYLPPLDMESEKFGLATLQDLSWKQLLDVDTCTRCGMCVEVCPAQATGKPLSPRQVIQGLRHGLPKTGWNAKVPAMSVFDLVSPDAAWACVTCYACEAACPVLIEIPEKLLGMRRNLVMVKQEMPERVQDVLHSLEVRGHPFPGLQAGTRTAWADGLNIPTLAEKPDAEYLLWVGCAGALVEANVTATQSLARLLQKAGVSFAILGDEEMCTGDPARRLGAEHFFLMFGEQNTETLKNYNIKKVIARCAHCFNSLKNDYKQLGLELEVIHHTEVLARLVADGRLTLDGEAAQRITYHDPCYLGRANGVFDEPRAALNGVPGMTLLEMARTKERAFCCGGGGSHSMFGDAGPKKINHARTEQALTTNPEVIAVGCPYCYQMFDDGLGAMEARHVKVKDVAEVLEAALQRERPPDP
ncbi:MAG: 4Fe-4S dicluster domain-containing protein [Chloroflexi bacterium]|nr:4Fe-4S dicluster domain-containing protein [Chloroflexota bacterium]